jgi:hypothetical protein
MSQDSALLSELQTLIKLFFDDHTPIYFADKGERIYQAFVQIFAQPQREVTAGELYTLPSQHPDDVTYTEIMKEAYSVCLNDITHEKDLINTTKKIKWRGSSRASAISRVTPLCFRTNRDALQEVLSRLYRFDPMISNKSEVVAYLLAINIGTGNLTDLLQFVQTLFLPALLNDTTEVFEHAQIPAIMQAFSMYTRSRNATATNNTLLRTRMHVHIEDNMERFKHIGMQKRLPKTVTDRQIIFAIFYEIDHIIVDFESQRTGYLQSTYYFEQIPFCVCPTQELVIILTPILSKLVEKLRVEDRLMVYCCLVLLRLLRLHIEQRRFTIIPQEPRHTLLRCAYQLSNNVYTKEEALRLLSCGLLYLKNDYGGDISQEKIIDKILNGMETSILPNHLQTTIYSVLIQTQLRDGAPLILEATQQSYRTVLLSLFMEQLRSYDHPRFDIRNRTTAFNFQLLITGMSVI